MIVAVDRNWGIGRSGGLLLRVPNDMKRFKAITTGGVVIYGRKTMETFPQMQPLPDRRNIVLTTKEDFCPKGTEIARSLDEMREMIKDEPPERVFCIGGESVYRQLLDETDICHVTWFDRVFDADAYFPDLDADPAWEMSFESEEQSYFDTPYTFRTYERRG